MAPVPTSGSGCIILNRQFAKLFALSAGQEGDGEEASLKDPDGGDDFGFKIVSSSPPWRVSFQFAGGPNYVGATLGGILEPSPDFDAPGDAQTWELINVRNDHEFFKIRNVSFGSYLTATSDFQVACLNPDGSHSQEWKVIPHNIRDFNPDELQDLASDEQGKLQSENDEAGIGEEADDAREDAAAANDSDYSGGGDSGGGDSGGGDSGGGYSGGNYSGAGYSGGNICGNPTCGVDHICAEDYNRIVQPMGYPGVPIARPSYS